MFFHYPLGEVTEWPIVKLNGVAYHVAPTYVAPVARKDLLALLVHHECELPTIALVDAIWRASDLKIAPILRDWSSPADMLNFASQRDAIDRAIGGRPFRLLAGTHKDFVREGERIDLYGLHTLQGKPLQPFGTSHSDGYVDYSQGVRLVRRVA
jgi:hypothetical protein